MDVVTLMTVTMLLWQSGDKLRPVESHLPLGQSLGNFGSLFETG
jgi:hypothetical protein